MKADDFLADVPSADDFLGEPDPVKRKNRGPTDYLRDAGAAVLKIGPTALRGIGDITQMATAGNFGGGLSKSMTQGMQTIDDVVGSDILRDEKGIVNQTIADPTKDWTDVIASLYHNPGALADMGVSTAGSMMLPMGVAGLAGKIAPLSARAATGIAVGTGAVQNAADTFTGTDADMTGKYKAAALSGAASAVLGKVLGGGLEGQLARRITGNAGVGGAKAIGKSMLKEGVQEFGEEGSNPLAQNVGEGQPLDFNQAGKQGTLGGILGAALGGGVTTLDTVASPERQIANLLADAIEADSNSMPARPDVMDNSMRAQPATVPERAVTPVTPAPTAAPIPQLPYDPTVQNPQRPVVVDQQGNARTMSADEFLAADETRQGAQELGLTPDVRRAQETRSTPAEPDPIPSDLLQRLRDSGWTPPREGNNPNPDPEQVDAIGQDLESLYQQDIKDGIKQRLGMDLPPASGKEDQPQSSAFRSFLRGVGIAPDLAGDLTGERGFKANSRLPGTFRKGGLQLDEIVTRAVERGFLTDAQVESTLDNGGTNALVEMIRAELRGERQVSSEVAGEQAQQQMDGRALEDLHSQADAIGFDTTGLDGDQINLALKRIERRRVRANGRMDVNQEVKAERQAMTDAQDLAGLDDADIPWNNDNNVSTEDAMRALGFTEQEISDATTERPAAAQEDRGGSGAPGQDASGPAQGTPAADQGSAPGQQGQAEGLTSYTPDELRARDKRIADEARAGAKQQADQEAKATADGQRDEFTLTGSDRTADANPDQTDIFSQPAEEPAKPVTREPVPKPPAVQDVVDLRTALTDRFGNLIDKMEARGFLKLWPSTQAFNEGQTSEKIDGPAQGYWDGKVAHLFADGIEPGNEVAVLLHEVGEHASMKKMLGAEAYSKLVERAYDLVDAEDQTAMRAIDRIPDDTPDHYKDSEFLAYMIETVAADGAQASPSARKWLADIVAAIRAWFSQTGFNKMLDRFGKGIELTPADIAALAVRAVRWQAEHGGGGGGQLSRGANYPSMRGTEEQAIAAGFTMRAYRGVDKNSPFNDTGTTWLTTSKEVAESYAEEVMGYDDPGVIVVMVKPDGLPRHDASRLTDEQREQLESDDFGNPQAIGIYDRSDDHPLGGSSRNVTVIHAPKDAVFLVDDGGQMSRPARPSNAAAAAANVFGGAPNVPATPAAPAGARNTAQQQQPNAASWAVADPGRLDDFTRYIQNSRIDIKRTVDAVKAAGQHVADDANPYLMDELYIGKVRAQLDHLADESIKPLLSAIANSGFKTDQVNEYLWARHAEERNRQMAKVNAVPFTQALDLAGMSTADANTKLAAYRAMPDFRKLQAIAKMVDQITEDARTKIVTDGLEEPGVIQAWEGAYKHYVPLQRDMEEAGGKASGYNVKGSESRRAVGSKKEAINILANVIAQAEATIIRSEKAAVGRSVLDMARQHPNPDFWTVDTPPTERVIDPRTGLVTNRVKPNYKALDNVFTVKEAGVEHFVVFNEDNPRAVQFARTLKNMDAANMGPVIEAIGKATRYLAQWVTSRNPLFWMTNFARDVQGVAFNLQSTPLKGQAPQVMANIPAALGGFARLHAGKKAGKWVVLAQEFKDAGGQTGYMDQYRDSVERMDQIVKEVGRLQQSKLDPRKIGRAVLDVLEAANDTIENGVRLAVYAQAREEGISQAQAASIAKNISVNFNRKGNASRVYNALYMFFNANVQGNVRMIQGVMQSRRAQGYAAALTMAGAAVALLNLAGGGDDEATKKKRYELVPEWERERNWIVFIPGTDRYVKVPLPLGPHVLFNAGRILAEIGFEDGADPVEKAASFVSSMFSAFNPVGGGFPSPDAKGAAQLVTPTIARPVVDLVVNQNFAGTPIARENNYPGYKKPNYLAGRESTAQYWSSAAQALNDWTGGDKIKPGHINLSPEQLAYLVKGYAFPGVAQTADTVAKQILSPKDTPAEQMIGVSKFFGKIDDLARTRAAYDKLREDEQRLGEYKNYISAGEREKAKDVLTEWGGGSEANGRKLLSQYTVTDRLLASIRKQKRTLAEHGDADTQVQKLDDMNERINRTLAVYLANTRDLRHKSAGRE